MLSYPTELLFYDNNDVKVQLNKLPQTTIILRIIDGTIRFNTNIRTWFTVHRFNRHPIVIAVDNNTIVD